jgi:hypothetical protein
MPNKYYSLFKTRLNEGLLFCLVDFSQGRKFKVEQSGHLSDIKFLDRACVQGSLLGLRLFSLFECELESELAKIDPTVDVISYADDTWRDFK